MHTLLLAVVSTTDGFFEPWFAARTPNTARGQSALRIQKWDSYFATYEKYLAPFRGRTSVNMLELGVLHGGSQDMWLDYLGAGARIWGVDIKRDIKQFDSARKTNLIGSVDNAAFLRSVCKRIGRIDIVLDDASHHNAHQIHAFDVLYSCLAPGGVYMVEDINTSYKRFQPFWSTSPNAMSFVAYATRKVDELQAYWSCPDVKSVTVDALGRCGCTSQNVCKDRSATPTHAITNFTRFTMGIHFHNGIVVFDKALQPQLPPVSVLGGPWKRAIVGE